MEHDEMMKKEQEQVHHYRAQLRQEIEKSAWIVAMDVLVPAVYIATQLKALGAKKVLAIGARRGVGPISEEIGSIDLDLPEASSAMEGIQEAEKALDQLPEWVVARINDFDPDNTARVIRTFFSSGKPVAGRPVFGARKESWMALEDKMIIDALWDEIGIARAESVLLSVTDPFLFQRASELDCGSGTVWAGDNREGFHGGAERIRWVRGREDAEMAKDYLSQFCDRIRVMPFLEGIPCSIHGWVFPAQTIAFRPCEMVVFQKPAASKFVYAGAATNWKPAEQIRKQMYDSAIKTGEYLRRTVDYRGCFTIDGIVTSDGFLPTELNPRFGGAISRMSIALPSLPLLLLHFATAAKAEIEWRPEVLRTLVVEAAEAHPQVRALLPLSDVTVTEDQKLYFRRESNDWILSAEEVDEVSSATLGMGASGALLFFHLHPSHIRRGEAAAPSILSAVDFVCRSLKIEPPLLIAPKQASIL